MSNYVPYHVHSTYSLLDSATRFEDYVDCAASLGMKAICFSEHGNVFGWFEKKQYCESKGIKFLYGIECYLTETLDEKTRDNYHTILIAKNRDGFVELNRLISLSYHPEQRYYKPRISFDQFLNISDNIIKISACLAGPLWSFKKRLDALEADGEDVSIRREKYIRLAEHYDYFEIQYHDGDQKEYNKNLYEMAQILGKPLIAGTDTHSLNQYKAECRIMLKYGKTDGDWGDSENSCDLTFKTYDELVDSFKSQNALPEEVYLEAIENTNRMADSVEDLVIDTSVKYPILYEGQDEEQIMQDRVMEMYHDKVNRGIIDGNDHRYLDNINTEMSVFKKINMVGFMLFMSELMCWARSQNIYTSPCRGSVGGSTVAYITDIIDLDPVKRHTVFSRFANEYRVEVGDIDTDWFEDDRPKIYQHMFDRFGYDKCAYILALGTLADAAVIDTIGKAYRIIDKQNNRDSYYTLDKTAEIKKEWSVNQDETRKKYPDIFKYYDGLVGCIVSQSMHPAGIVVSPIDLIDNYSVFQKDDMQILPLSMEEIHDIGLVKYDILGLKNVGIISKTCSYIGSELPHEYNIDWDDQDVFDSMVKSPVGIFQFESSYAFDTLKKYHANIKKRGLPFTIDDMTVCNACIRPSGASYRDDLIALKEHKNPSPMIDKLLENTHGHLVYQEQVIAFLQEICGLSGGEADNVRRAIGRKQIDRLEAALPGILEGDCKKSDKTRDVAGEEARQVLQIIEDSASYMFGFNHATGYSMIGYLCAYYRYYYPLEFCTAFLNCSKTDVDIAAGTMLVKQLGFNIMPARFRYSRSGFYYDKDSRAIYKSVDSIKNLNAQSANELYELRNNTYDHFTDLLYDIKMKTSLQADQLDILIKLDFFEEFGEVNKLLYVAERFATLHGRKEIRFDALDKFILDFDTLDKFSNSKTATRIDEIDVLRHAIDHGLDAQDVEKYRTPKGRLSTKRYVKDHNLALDQHMLPYATKIVIGRFSDIDNRGLIMYLEDNYKGTECTIQNKIAWQKEYLGYVDYKDPNKDPRIIMVTNLDTKYSPRFTGYCLKNGQTCDFKVHSKRNYKDKSIKTAFRDVPFMDGDFLYMDECQKKQRVRKVENGFENVPGEYVWWIKKYHKLT